MKTKTWTDDVASEGKDVRGSVPARLARDHGVENWLHHQVGPAFDSLKADPGSTLTADQVRARLASAHTARMAAR